MRSSAAPLAIYALLIATTSVVLWVWTPYTLPPALLSGGAVLFAVVAVVVAVRGDKLDRRRERPEGGSRAVPDLSFATVGVALGVINIVVGLYLGLYLILIGAGILAFGIGGWIREARSQRRAHRLVEDGADAR
jgi:heme A synthase